MPSKPLTHRPPGWKPAPSSGWQRAPRKDSSTARGYGSDWQRLRARILAAEPLCRLCAQQGRTTAATDVDHIEPFAGLDDPKRLDPANLRSLCQPCHMGRTARQASGRPAVVGCDADGWPADPSHPWRKNVARKKVARG